jgi:hypothetical protein
MNLGFGVFAFTLFFTLKVVVQPAFGRNKLIHSKSIFFPAHNQNRLQVVVT